MGLDNMPGVGGVPSSLREGNTHTTEASCGPAPAGKVTGDMDRTGGAG